MTYPFHHISTRWKLFARASATVALVAILSFIAINQSSYDSNLATLHELQQQNQADTVFHSDSLQRHLAAYFDRQAYMPGGWLHPTRTANERMLAHYLLGRALADMGDAPSAIDSYKDAVACADTTDTECDYSVLRSVYGQMAYIYNEQNLPDAQMSALRNCERCEWIIGDTLSAIAYYARQMSAYYIKGDTDSVMIVAREMTRRYDAAGHTIEATHFLGIPLSIYLDQGKYDEASRMLNLIQTNPEIFDSINKPKTGRELYYFYIGQAYDGREQLDSAEYFYRKALEHGFDEAGFRGLLSIYHKRHNGDSIFKYARLYADANDYSHDQMRTGDVQRATMLYDYTTQRRIADKKEKEAERLRYGIFLLALLCTLLYVWAKRNQERRREEIRQLYARLELAQLRLNKSEAELECMETGKNGDDIENNNSAIIEKREEVTKLRMSEKKIREQIEKTKVSDYMSMLAQDASICRMKELAQPGLNNPCPSDADWERLLDVCRPRLGRAMQMVEKDERLTRRDLLACMLVMLGFTNKELMMLFGLDTRQAANEIKKKLNRHLFDDNSARTLRSNLQGCLLS